MTLVELMVVVAIIGLLAVAVLPLLASSSESRKTREAARSLVSYVARSQSRVLGRTEWGGFWMVPVAGTNYALDLFAADVPAVFQGDNLPTLVTGTANPSTGQFEISASSPNKIVGTTVTGSIGDLVRFDGAGPWFALTSTSGISVALRAGGTFGGVVIENANQTTYNTPWPTADVPHTFELMRQPIRSGSPFTFGDARCVDVAQSGYVGSSGYTQFAAAPSSPASTAVLFDGTGRLRQLVAGGSRITPTGAVFLLVGRSDRAVWSPPTLNPDDDSTGYNWQYADSYWIGIDPLTGVAKVAECKPVSLPGSPTDLQVLTALVESQSYIRSELLATGR
jgi:type II secretory pathway pseudopilin PulG